VWLYEIVVESDRSSLRFTFKSLFYIFFFLIVSAIAIWIWTLSHQFWTLELTYHCLCARECVGAMSIFASVWLK